MIDVETLYTAARELRETLLPAIQALIPHASNQVTESQAGTRKATVHRIPWHGPAAGVFYDIHAQVRRYESALTLLLFQHARFRGGDDTNTYDALSRLPVLIAHAIDAGYQDHGDVRDAAQLLGVTWPRECRRVLDALRDDEQPWTRAPGNLRCPHCLEHLWLAPGWSHNPDTANAACRNPDCVREQGPVSFEPARWVGLVQPDQVPESDLLTVEQMADRLGVAPGTVRSWASRGTLRAVGATTRGAKLYRLSDAPERATA